MNIKTAIYLLSFLISSLSSFAQVQRFSQVKNYTTDDGLPHNIAYNLIQDHKGYIWICTDDGLARFNGKSFKTYRSADGLLNNYIINISENKDGKLWVGSWEGGLNYVYNDSVFTPKLDVTLSRIAHLQVRDDQMWLSDQKEHLYPYTYVNNAWKFSHAPKAKILYLTKDSLLKYDAFIYPELLDKTGYAAALENPRGYITTDKVKLMYRALPGIWQYHQGGTFTPFMPEVTKNDTIYGLHQDATQRFWMGAKGKIITVDASQKVKVIQKGLPNGRIYNIKSTRDGKIYFIIEDINLNHRKAYCYDPVTQTSIDLKARLGMKALPVEVVVDQEDNVWLITNGEGVYCIPATPFANFNESQGLSTAFVNTINEDARGNIYVGTIDGLFKLKDGRFVRQKIPNQNVGKRVQHIIKAPDGLLIELSSVMRQAYHAFIGLSSGLKPCTFSAIL